jgi:TolB-like protein/class 3 adenylate cyclase/Flp pilus assembly protein TadD
MPTDRVQRRLVAILSADVVGYSRLMGRDETGTLTRLKSVRRDLVDPQIAAHAGRMVKLMGDGALVEFASAVDAVTCAIEIQKRMREHNIDISEDDRIEFRIGINVGDVIVDADDIYGDGVNVAARIQALADPGGIYISRSAADQVRDKVPITIETRGEQSVKNIARPIEVFCIVANDHAPISVTVAAVGKPAKPPAPSDKPSIAVLAFNNMSGDTEQEYFSDGISEDIITDLSKLPDLHVIARNSSFVYKKLQAVSLPDVARDLGVRYVLEGSVRKAGNRIRVTAQLIDTATGGHIWADRYDRDLTDIFAVQDELTREIIAALKLKLTPEQKGRLGNKRTLNVEAFNLFLRGRERLWLATRPGNLAAIALFEDALRLDPGYVAAQASIGFIHFNNYVNGWSDETSLETAIAAAERAVEMDAEEPQGYFTLGVSLLFQRQHDRALAAAQRCLALAPSSAEGHLATANILMYSGRGAEAIATIDTYRRLDPHHPDLALYFLAEAQFVEGLLEEAVATLQLRLARDPSSETSNALLAACYGHLGRSEESRAAWAEVLRLAPGFSIARRRRILPFKDPAVFEHRVDGLRKAGIPV